MCNEQITLKYENKNYFIEKTPWNNGTCSLTGTNVFKSDHFDMTCTLKNPVS